MRYEHVEHARENSGEDPEHHKPKADHADGAVKQLAVKPKAAFVMDRHGEDCDQRNPNGYEPFEHNADDPACPVGQ